MAATDRDQFKDAVKERIAADPLGFYGRYLSDLKQSGADRWQARCVFHADDTPSLTVHADGRFHCYGCGADGDGLAFVQTHKGCSFPDALAEAAGVYGLEPPKPRRGKAGTGEGHVVNVYKLYDVEGALVAEHRRYEPKDFRWYRDGKPGLKGLSTKALPLYNLPALMQADERALVVVTEGEKAADSLVAAGQLAVATVCGAQTLPADSVLQPLLGKIAVLWPDRDAVGGTHMQAIAGRLRAMGGNPMWLEWPDAPDHGDAADYMADHSPEELQDFLTAHACDVLTPATPAKDATPSDLFEQALPQTGWLRDYVEFATPCTESPRVFHLAVALSCVSAAIGRRAWLPLPPGRLHANLFTALIGGQGLVRKSTALALGDSIVSNAFPDLLYAGDATAEALCGKVLQDQSERLVFADELSRLLGGPDYMAGLKPMLAELFNCPRTLSRSRMGQGSGQVESPTVSILGASTVSWLRSAVKSHDVGGGLLSRFLWYVADAEGRILALPPPPDETTRRDLVTRLQQLRGSLGQGRLLDLRPIEESYTRFYADFHALAEREDEEGIGGFLARLASTHAPKLMMLYTLAENPAATAISPDCVEPVAALCELLRRGLFAVVDRVSESKMDQLREKLFRLVTKTPGITRREALQRGNCQAREFDDCIKTLLESGRLYATRGERGGAIYWPQAG